MNDIFSGFSLIVTGVFALIVFVTICTAWEKMTGFWKVVSVLIFIGLAGQAVGALHLF